MSRRVAHSPRFRLASWATSESDEVRVFESGPWTRLTTPRGHVLIKRKAWRLAR